MTKFSNIVEKFSLQLFGYLISEINFPNILENLVMSQPAFARAFVHHMFNYKEALGTRLFGMYSRCIQ